MTVTRRNVDLPIPRYFAPVIYDKCPNALTVGFEFHIPEFFRSSVDIRITLPELLILRTLTVNFLQL